MNLPPETSDEPQPELQPSAKEEENQDASPPEVTQSEVNLIFSDIQPEASEALIDSPPPSEPVTRAPCSRHSRRRNPTLCGYQDYLTLELSNKLASAKSNMNKIA